VGECSSLTKSENAAMTKTWLAAAAALTLISGTAMAETVTTTTTQTTAPYIAPLPAPVAQTTTERVVESDGSGVVRSTTTVTGTEVNPLGETTTTRRTVETTTSR
jgi:hypothetical protein